MFELKTHCNSVQRKNCKTCVIVQILIKLSVWKAASLLYGCFFVLCWNIWKAWDKRQTLLEKTMHNHKQSDQVTFRQSKLPNSFSMLVAWLRGRQYEAVGWSTNLVETEIPQLLLDKSPWYFMETFMIHRQLIHRQLYRLL